MNVDDIVSALRRVVEGDPRVDAAFLYGSAARQQMRPGSDVDVAVRWSGTVGDPARAYLELLGPLGQAVPHDVHLVDLATASPELQRRIYADGVELVDRHPRRTRDNHVKGSLKSPIGSTPGGCGARRFDPHCRPPRRAVVDPEILEARTLHVLHHVGRLRAQSATTAEAFAGVGDLEQFLRALGPSATAG